MIRRIVSLPFSSRISTMVLALDELQMTFLCSRTFGQVCHHDLTIHPPCIFEGEQWILEVFDEIRHSILHDTGDRSSFEFRIPNEADEVAEI